MKLMMIASFGGAGALLAASQLGSSGDFGAMVQDEMGLTEGMLKSAVKTADAALGQGTDVSFTVLAVAAMPVLFHVVKSGLAMMKDEHELSIAKRRKAAGIDHKPAE